jgi:hypothetical protein
MVIAAAHSHSNVIWGVVLIALGIVHFIFRGFYARRSQAIHDARQATAPRITQGLYRNHSDSWYMRSQYWGSALLIVLGVVNLVIGL